MYNAAPPAGIGAVGGALATTGAESAGITMIAIALILGGLLTLRAAHLKRHRAQTSH